MSQYPRDDHNITPDWDDLDLDWLDGFDKKPPADESRRDVRQTRPAPEQPPEQSRSPRQAPPQNPEQSRSPRQAPPQNREQNRSSRQSPPQNREQSRSPRQAPPQNREQSRSSRQSPPQNREQSRSQRQSPPQSREQNRSQRQAPPQGREQSRSPRQSTPQNREQNRSARQAPPQNREQNRSQRQGEPSRRNRQPARREVAPPEASPWEQEQEDPRYRRRPARRRKSNAPLIILIVVLVAGMCIAGWKLGSIFLNYRRDRSSYNDLASHAISGLAEFETEDDAGDDSGAARNLTGSEIPISVDWDYLRSINPNVAGWLYCPGTVISYPVVQSSDHEYYLTHGFDDSANVSGTLFADRDSVAGITQSNYIIYGHNMKDNSMFGTFANYVDKSYYDENPILYYLTPDANYRVELLCAHVTESTLNNYPTYFASTADYQAYLNEITSSAFWVNYDVLSTDYQLMSMSTCTSASGYSDPRMLVHGMMIPLDEPAREQAPAND